jgi:hypothetical protein
MAAMLATRSEARRMLREHSAEAFASAAAEEVGARLSVADFFARAFALAGDVELDLAGRGWPWRWVGALALEADRRSDGRGGARGPARGGLPDHDGEQAARLNGRRRRLMLTRAARSAMQRSGGRGEAPGGEEEAATGGGEQPSGR